ncbi:MAG TPA: PPOX class F420-dependent oxidoreductase [Candidatus Binatia bacterium]|nr:PPOX class F420-dependent oxidoreductase [Candidatus Binatia bacterium]
MTGKTASDSYRLPDEAKALIRGANFAHLATLMLDGSPQADPVWVDLEGEQIVIGSSASTVKCRNAKRDPRVAVSVVSTDNPYLEAQFRGRVVDVRPDPDLATMDRISRKYTGRAFPFRQSPQRIVMVIEVEWARTAKLPLTHAPDDGLIGTAHNALTDKK